LADRAAGAPGLSGIDDFIAAAGLAASKLPARVIELAPAGIRVRVNLIGERVGEALAGGLLAAEPGAAGPGAAPAIELDVFDSAESGVRPPKPPWPAATFDSQRHEIAGYTEPPELALFDIDHGTLSYFDARAGRGVQWFRDARSMSSGEGGSPLRNLLRWSLAAHDVYLLHLAAAGGVLFGGIGGAGKSTSSLTCALAGLPFTSDDFSAVTLGARPEAHAVYAYVKATQATLGLLPELAEFGPLAGLDWRGKQRIDMTAKITPSQEVFAIVLPELAERTGELVELSQAEAMRRVTSGSLAVMQCDVQRSLTALRELVELLPAFKLPVGPDVEAIPAALAPLARSAAPS
jgi:hypothetical protein